MEFTTAAAKPKDHPAVAALKGILTGVAIGAGMYVAWVALHAAFFGAF